MKTRLFFTFFIISFLYSHAQIITIPDINFKNALIYTNCVDTDGDNIPDSDVDINNDGEIQVVEAELITSLKVASNEYNITSVEGIEFFVNLIRLDFPTFFEVTSIDITSLSNLEYFRSSFNDGLTQLNVVGLSNLKTLLIDTNSITSLDLTGLTNLEFLECSYTQLESIDLSGLDNLITFETQFNQITTLDISQNLQLENLLIAQSPVETLFLKNGALQTIDFFWLNNPQYICADDSIIPTIETIALNEGYTGLAINSYCSFSPGGDSYEIVGQNKLDVDSNGCDINDYLYPNLKFHINDGTTSGTYISDVTGNYSISVLEGTHTLTPISDNPEYYTAPNPVSLNFPVEASPFNQDFCVLPNGVFNDLEVFIVPLTEAVPGFDSEYKIVYRNVGNTALSGTVEFDYSFDNDFMQYGSSIPSEVSNTNNILSWDYMDLAPFETREIVVTFNLNTPTDANFPLNSDDELNFEVAISPSLNDETSDNNDFGLKQIVVNSFDPNDIRCLEGETILPERVGDYVHYLIRFENLGTANATNIVVKNAIDANKFDINTLVPLDGSHAYYTRINAQNEVEFIFENINLPFDDANNDGYVVFKIKTLDFLVLGDTFSNQAKIYFDFNAPIITNTYVTEVAEDNLSISDLNTLNTRVYPNPSSNSITIESDAVISSAAVYDINGRLILTKVFEGAEYQFDVDRLNSGIYFLKVNSNTETETVKLVKN